MRGRKRERVKSLAYKILFFFYWIFHFMYFFMEELKRMGRWKEVESRGEFEGAITLTKVRWEGWWRWLTKWLTHWLTHRLIDWLIDCMIEWSTHCVTNWLSHQLSEWVTDWLCAWLLSMGPETGRDWGRESEVDLLRVDRRVVENGIIGIKRR